MARIHAERARRLVGIPFRPQGHELGTGLDCFGLILVVHEIPRTAARSNYRLRGDHVAEVEAGLFRHFRKAALAREGDVLLLQVANDQLHLAVRTRDGFVHADARLRKVVETPGEPRWPILGAYRRRSKPKA